MSKISTFACDEGSRPCGPLFSGGVLYYADSASGDIRSADVEGNPGADHELYGNTGGQPTGLAVAGDANEDAGGALPTFYISDLAHVGVIAQSRDGAQQKVVGEYEKKNLRGPTSIAFSANGSMFFCDAGPLGDTTLAKPSGRYAIPTRKIYTVATRTSDIKILRRSNWPNSLFEPSLADQHLAENRWLRFVLHLSQ